MRLIYTCLLVLACSLTFAQDRGRGKDDWEKLKAARIAFLTNRLQLNTETAQKFWPIFNEYETKKESLSDKYNKQKRELVSETGWRNITPKNADKMLEIYLDQKQAELDLEKEYLAKFNKVLDNRQIWMVIRIDSDFRRSLMRRISDDKDRKPRDSDDDGGNNKRPKDRN